MILVDSAFFVKKQNTVGSTNNSTNSSSNIGSSGRSSSNSSSSSNPNNKRLQKLKKKSKKSTKPRKNQKTTKPKKKQGPGRPHTDVCGLSIGGGSATQFGSVTCAPHGTCLMRRHGRLYGDWSRDGPVLRSWQPLAGVTSLEIQCTGAAPGQDPTLGEGWYLPPPLLQTLRWLYGTMGFVGAVLSPEAPEILLKAYGRGKFFCLTLCLYTQNTQNFVETSKTDEKHKKGV